MKITSDKTTQARAELNVLIEEQKALPAKIHVTLKLLSADKEGELQQLYTRRDALPRLVDLARIKVLGAEIADLEAEAGEARQRREEGKPIIAEARKRLEAAQTEMLKVQRQYGGFDADVRFVNIEIANKRRELDGLIAQQTAERGAPVYSVWQMK